jgi:hypothetical protein
MQKQILKFLFFLSLFLILPNFTHAAPIPVLNFSDIESGPKTGNTDGVGSGAIVTIWGNYLGSSQGTSKIYIGDQEATTIYYWKNADGQLPSGPADLYSSHKMQEIAFSIPATAPDGLTTIKVVVNGIETNTLPFAVRTGNIYFVKAGGSDTTGNGSWGSAWATLQNVFNGGNGKLMAGDIVYSVGVGSTAGLSVGFGGAIKATQLNPIALVLYPNTALLMSGHAAGNNYGYVINNWYSSNSLYSSEYINFSKIKILAEGDGTESSSGVHTFKGNRIVGLEITGPTVYGGYGGAISGSGGFGGAGAGENAGGGKYLGIYMHDYGWKSTMAGVGNYGWIFVNNASSWTGPSCANRLPTCVGTSCIIGADCTTEPGGCTYANVKCKYSVDGFQHLYYISDRSPDAINGYEIGWNNLINNPILQGIHIYDQGPNIGGWNTPIIIHDNLVKNQRASSIDVAYPKADVGPNAGTAAPIYIYNNIIVNDEGGIDNGWALNIQGSGDAKVYNNTVHGFRYINIMRPATSDYRNNLMVEADLPIDYHYYIYDTPTMKSNNLFYGTKSSPMPAWFSAGAGDLNTDPLFTDAANYDFSLQATSPAKTAGSDATLLTAPTDFYGQPRLAGSVSMGAIQYVSAIIDLIAPSAPSGLNVL